MLSNKSRAASISIKGWDLSLQAKTETHMSDTTDRRNFMKSAGAVVAGVVALRALLPVSALAKDAVQADKNTWVAVLGKLKDLNEKNPVLVKAQFKDEKGNIAHEEKIYVRWQRIGKDNGRWIVLSSICPHLKCKVDFVSDDEIFKCPCHGSQFDLDGSVTHGPAKKDLQDYSGQAVEDNGMLKLCRDAE